MLPEQTVIINWNSKIKKHYVDKGYVFTKMKDPFEVNVHDLTDGSNVKVRVICDYCGAESMVVWCSYNMLQRKCLIHKDCCNSPECTTKKAQETLMAKYGVFYASKIDGVQEKIRKTNLERYGAENPFASEEIKEKISKINYEKYGGNSSMCRPDIVKKAKLTSLRKYGVEHYAQTQEYRARFSKENSPVWKGGKDYIRDERKTLEYNDWRKAVFARDRYTCQCCGAKSHRGSGVELHAHHIANWKDNIDCRYDVNNGIALCDKCHYKFHSIYGKRNNTRKQLEEFLRQKDMLNLQENKLQELSDKKLAG